MYTVDKWTRMLIRNISEYNRLLWGERCDILHAESDCTYQDRQRQEIINLCQYLRRNKHLLSTQDLHFLNKDSSFFFRSPIDNVLNWEKRVVIGLQPNKEKKTRDIRGYMFSEPTQDQNACQPDNVRVTKKPLYDKTSQTNIDSFVLTPHSIANTQTIPNQQATQQRKKQRLTQPTLYHSLPSRPQSQQTVHTMQQQHTLKRPSNTNFDPNAERKKPRITPIHSTSKRSTFSTITQARFKKRRLIASSNADTISPYPDLTTISSRVFYY